MTIITRRQALVLVIVMGLLAMSLALSWDVFIDRDQTVSAQEAGQEAREQRDALVSSLTPGAVLYQKFSHYNRHASTPETVRETWMRLGPGASVVAEVSKTYDANGTLVATGVMSNGVTFYNDLVHSRSYEMPAIAIEGFHDWPHDVWTLPDRLVQEGFSDMGQGTLNGKTSLIYETTGTVTFDEAVGPQSTRTEIELVRDAPLLHRETHYTDGVKDKETILIEYRVEDVMPPAP